MSIWLLILIIVLVVLAFGGFGYSSASSIYSSLLQGWGRKVPTSLSE
jgi:hypothetical protein